MAEKDIHYYEPANGHGLNHDPFNAIVAPRPIGWISSRDAKGNINLAPYSFFNAFCYKPPIVGFSSTSWKDSVSNIQETKEFCWNLSIMDLAKQMNATSAHVAHSGLRHEEWHRNTCTASKSGLPEVNDVTPGDA